MIILLALVLSLAPTPVNEGLPEGVTVTESDAAPYSTSLLGLSPHFIQEAITTNPLVDILSKFAPLPSPIGCKGVVQYKPPGHDAHPRQEEYGAPPTRIVTKYGNGCKEGCTVSFQINIFFEGMYRYTKLYEFSAECGKSLGYFYKDYVRVIMYCMPCEIVRRPW